MPTAPYTPALTNYEAALKAERAKCVRGFHPYTSEQRAMRAASFRLGHRQRTSIGEAFWTHPDLPDVCFPTGIAAARAALAKAS